MSTAPPNVAFLGINYAPEHTGIAPYTAAMCAALAESMAVEVFTTYPHYPAWRFPAGRLSRTTSAVQGRVAVTRLKHYLPNPPKGFKRLWSEVTFGLRLSTRRWADPDLVVFVSPAMVSSAIAALAARVRYRRTPRVVWVQDLYSVGAAETGGNSLVTRVLTLIEGSLLRSADRVVAIHQRFADRMIADFKVDPARIVVIRNWTHVPELRPFSRADRRAALGWSDSETIVVHSGNMGVKQGLENVIEAARLAERSKRSVRFVLIGDGSERARLEQLAAGCTHIDFMPALSDNDFLPTLASADILLVNELPGVAEMAVPSKLTSYFAAARPVVAATATDGITAAEIAAANAGVVVAAGAPEALLDAVVTLGHEKVYMDELGSNGRLYSQNVLSEKHAVEQFCELMGNLGVAT